MGKLESKLQYEEQLFAIKQLNTNIVRLIEITEKKAYPIPPTDITADVRGVVSVQNEIGLTWNSIEPLLEEIKELSATLSAKLDENKPVAVEEVTVKNLETLKFPKEMSIKDISKVLDYLKTIAGKDLNITVNPDTNEITFPTSIKDAIPVRLVDKSGREYYDAMMAVSAGGGDSDKNYTIKIRAKSDDAKVTYIGFASIGTAESAAKWQIMRIDENIKADIEWSDGNDRFDNVWNNRESLVYS